MSDLIDRIDRQAMIDAILQRVDALKGLKLGTSTFRDGIADGYARILSDLQYLPSAQPEGWMERNKDRILQAGKEGREVEFRIDGRLFAIREKAQ